MPVEDVNVGVTDRRFRWSSLVAGAILGGVGFLLLVGGLYLVTLGGSFYFATAGALMSAAAVLYFRRDVRGEWTYALVLLGTLIWALVESDDTPWALVSRLFAPAVLGLFLALPWVRRTFRNPARSAMLRYPTGILSLVILTVIVVSFWRYTGMAYGPAGTDGPLTPIAAHAAPQDTDWQNYGNGPGGAKYSDLTQINADNVSRLEKAWEFRSGNAPLLNQAEATPIKIGRTLFTCDPHSTVIAIDATTGRELWRNKSTMPGITPVTHLACRGVAYYRQPGATGECAERVLVGGPMESLRAMDARTGRLCPGFGKGGEVDLKEGLGPIQRWHYTPTSAPAIIDGKVVLGAMTYDKVLMPGQTISTSDPRELERPSGVVRAFDAVTGKLAWAWDMGAPDRIGAPAPGENYTRNTPNVWGGMTADPDLGLVYVPVGNPYPNLWGVKRRDFDLKYGTSLVALRASDGRPQWSFQAIRHDLWDYDNPSPPVLTDVAGPGGPIPAVLLATKPGNIFVLDRRSGKPILPVRELKNLPVSKIPGERTSPSQPMSAMSAFAPKVTESQMWGATPIDQMLCRIAFRKLRYDGPFTPPGLDATLLNPGTQGELSWGGVSVDRERQIAVVNITHLPTVLRMIPNEKVAANANRGLEGSSAVFSMINTPYSFSMGPFFSQIGLPCTQPPVGELAAFDMKTGKQLWRKPLGTTRDQGPFGIKLPFPLIFGVQTSGGSVVTKGGLIFIAASADRTFRAYDIRTGELRWQYELPAGGNAVPMTYMAGGRQYIVLTVGGHSIMQSASGDYTLAFALPK